MNVVVDKHAGFCFGVVNAIELAEHYLEEHEYLYCLGEIVHNQEEVKRLSGLGLKVIDRESFRKLKNETVLIRAHGEPQETYRTAWDNELSLLEGTCPIVVRLQKMIRQTAQEQQPQIVIFGKPNHPEAIGLASQANGKAQVGSSVEELQLDYCQPIRIYSQTTMDAELYEEFCSYIQEQARLQCEKPDVQVQRSVCGKVANRAKQVREFAAVVDVLIFVSGKNSSNGNYLFQVAKKVNKKSHFISSVEELEESWFKDAETLGISGATSTPSWLMEDVEKKISKNF